MMVNKRRKQFAKCKPKINYAVDNSPSYVYSSISAGKPNGGYPQLSQQGLAAAFESVIKYPSFGCRCFVKKEIHLVLEQTDYIEKQGGKQAVLLSLYSPFIPFCSILLITDKYRKIQGLQAGLESLSCRDPSIIR